MSVPESLIEVRQHEGQDYKPLIDFEAWRVAIMNFTPELVADKIHRMQKHLQTDEVFVLLAGRCILLLGEGQETVTRIHAVDMQPFNVYNIKRGAWHSHTFSTDARVLIVENSDTADANSPFTSLNEEQRQEVVRLTKAFWR